MRTEDKSILPKTLRANGGYHLGTQWYLSGWKPLSYQYAFHQFLTPNVSFLAGIAAGKTISTAASYAMDCITIPHFKALNTSVTARQSTLVFDMFESWVEDNPRLEALVDDIKLRPYPLITFKNYSAWEFRTAGTDARFIRGSEYDRINFDEAGLEHTGSVAKVLRGRLRGTRPDGTTRMARFDVITSPTGAPWLKERFYRGIKDQPRTDLSLYRSMRVETYDNTHLTKSQIRAMEADYPAEMIDVELRGMFPDYGYSMFPSRHIDACTDQSKYDAVHMALNPEDGGKAKPGYEVAEDPRHGIIKFQMPRHGGRSYIMAGDPGTENAPKRSAGVIIVADITDAPYIDMVAFHWVSGMGSYNPFLQSYKRHLNKYDCVLKGIDITGTQKAIGELAFENHGIETNGLNFSSDKNAMLNALSLDLSNHRWTFPPIGGLLRQCKQYTRADDKRMAQDIVMTMAMISHLARYIPRKRQRENQTKKNNYRDRNKRTETRRRR